MRHGKHSGVDALHLLAELLAHGAEVALHLLGDDAVTAYELQLFHVNLVQDKALHRLNALPELRVCRGDGDALQGLLHCYLLFLAQRKHHGCHLLCQVHTALLLLVYQALVRHGERGKVHARRLALACGSGEVSPKAVGIEGSYRCHQACHGLKAGVQRLIGGAFVLAHRTAPEALLREAHEPVGHVVDDERLYKPPRTCGLVCLVASRYLLHQRVKLRDDPAVHLRSPFHRHCRLFEVPAVHVGVHSQEGVGLEQLAEERAADLLHALEVELKVVPRSGVRYHIPAHCVRAVLLYRAERVDGVAQALRHLHPVLVKHQAVGDDSLEGDRVEDHRGYGVKGEEPAACLVNALGYEVGGEDLATVERLLVLERIVYLGVRHRAAVEPHVHEVRLTPQHCPTLPHEQYLVNERAVKVYTVVVLLAHIPRDEAALLQRVTGHHASRHSLLYLAVQLLEAAYAKFLTGVPVTPYRQRRTPEA